jgi:hypothetical protein
MAFRHTIQSAGVPIADLMPALTTERRLTGLTLHADVAATTGDVFYLRLISGLGDEFDTVLYSITLSTASTTDIAKTDFNLPMFVGDALRVDFTNTDGRTYGISLILE